MMEQIGSKKEGKSAFFHKTQLAVSQSDSVDLACLCSEHLGTHTKKASSVLPSAQRVALRIRTSTPRRLLRALCAFSEFFHMALLDVIFVDAGTKKIYELSFCRKMVPGVKKK